LVDRVRPIGEAGVLPGEKRHVRATTGTRRNYRSHQDTPRTRVVSFKLSAEEYETLSAAADNEGLALGAYAAQVSLAAARGVGWPEYAALRQLLGAVMQASGQARRIGVNFNQVVAALNSTGEFSDQLTLYAAAAARAVRKLDEVADEVRRRLP
jgi:hypothetical protein